MNFYGAELRFHGPVLIGVLLSVISIYLVFIYARFLKEINFPRPVIPIILRSLALSGAIVMVMGPVVYYMEKVPVQRSVAVAVDMSQSMSVPDVSGEARVVAALEDMGAINTGMNERLTFFVFGDELKEVRGPDDLSLNDPTYGKTSIGAVVDRIRSSDAMSPTDIVLLTDGRDTSGIEIMPGRQSRIHSITYGDSLGFKNIGLYGVRAPEYGFLNEGYRVEGKFYATGVDEKAVAGIELFEDGIRVGQLSVDIVGEEGQMSSFSLSHIPDQPGIKEMEVRVKLDEEEIVREDNSYRFFVDIISERHRVLLLDSPSWDFRFLADFLKEQEKPALDVVLTGPGKVFRGDGIKPVLRNAGELGKYKLIIVGSGAGYLSTSERNALVEYVEVGGRLVVMGGPGSLTGAGGAWNRILGTGGGLSQVMQMVSK